ncbi:UxaA family hydrolase [Variibacter gotjawalensis]|uniref:UxaA family hydrolase n=1 Tax=Variibacter gotjawalensis TaxID=1333996 RepID=UPI0018D4EA81|nr:UxaA family hydrolase [Variibacter gotjawalensis]NIK47674.1 altronate dehydratase small subunit [Variibacter gotjawalensis]
MLNGDDNVATLVDSARKGEAVQLAGNAKGLVDLVRDVAFGHKFALRPIAKGETILKYGKVIGQATDAIATGDHVHVHNVEALRGRGDKQGAR